MTVFTIVKGSVSVMQLVEKLMTWMKLTFVEVPTHSLYRIHVKRVERSTKSTKYEIQT